MVRRGGRRGSSGGSGGGGGAALASACSARDAATVKAVNNLLLERPVSLTLTMLLCVPRSSWSIARCLPCRYLTAPPAAAACS